MVYRDSLARLKGFFFICDDCNEIPDKDTSMKTAIKSAQVISFLLIAGGGIVLFVSLYAENATEIWTGFVGCLSLIGAGTFLYLVAGIAEYVEFIATSVDDLNAEISAMRRR
jgi:hypothetical protein